MSNEDGWQHPPPPPKRTPFLHSSPHSAAQSDIVNFPHRASWLALLAQYPIAERNEIGGACSTYGGKEEVHTGFWWGDLKGKKQLGRPRRKLEDNKIDLNP